MIEIQPTTEHPVPFDLSDEQPKTHKDGIAIAANTSDLIDQLGPGLEFQDKDLHKVADRSRRLLPCGSGPLYRSY